MDTVQRVNGWVVPRYIALVVMAWIAVRVMDSGDYVISVDDR